MSRAAIHRPKKDDLRKMSVVELNAHIRALKSELTWRPKTSYAYKSVAKQLEVAEKVREIRRGQEKAGDV